MKWFLLPCVQDLTLTIEGKEPAVYSYLVSRVFEEARKLGIEITDDENSINFKRSQAILVINVYKLFKSKSSFEVLERNIPIERQPIGNWQIILR